MTQQLDSPSAVTPTESPVEDDRPRRRSTFTPVTPAEPESEPVAEPVAAQAPPAVEGDGSATVDRDLEVQADADVEPLTEPESETAAEPPAAEPAATAAPIDSTSDTLYPAPPERGSLEDEDLVALVERHTDDTATIDLIGILQAQLTLRAEEAARFAEWEERMRRIGTAEAIGAVEQTRKQFTGVIPVQVVESDPDADVTPAAGIPIAAPDHADLRTAADLGFAAMEPTPLLRSTTAEQPISSAPDDAPQPTRIGFRILVVALSIAALALIAGALAVTLSGEAVITAAALTAAAVPAAAWLGIAAGRLLRRRGSRPTKGGTWARAVGFVVAVAAGEGLIRSTVGSFSWQGYLLRRLRLDGMAQPETILSGLAAAFVIALVVSIVAALARAPKRPDAQLS